MQYILFVLSLLLYLFAPNNYSWVYCVVAMAVFVVNYMLIYKNDHKIGFNLFFAVAFWSASFVFPIFVYPIDSEYSLFHFGYDRNVITKATCLAQLAYSIYAVGYMTALTRKIDPRISKRNTIILTENNLSYLFFFSVAIFMIVALGGGYNYFSSQYNLDSSGSTSAVFKYLFIILNLTVTLLCISLDSIRNKFFRYAVILYALFVVLLYLISGSRTYPIAVLLILSYVLFRKRLRAWQFLLFVFGGIILLSLVGSTRSSGVTVEGMIVEYSADRTWYDYLLDMIVTNRNLYDAYSYVQTESITWGVTFLGPVLAIIPFAQSVFCNISGIPSFALGSASFITYNMFGKDMPFGLGTHIVGDIYMGAGLFGVFAFFFLLGYMVSYSYKRMEHGSFRWMVVFMILLSDSVFMCRGTMFEIMRTVLWAQLLIIIFESKGWKMKKTKNFRLSSL